MLLNRQSRTNMTHYKVCPGKFGVKVQASPNSIVGTLACYSTLPSYWRFRNALHPTHTLKHSFCIFSIPFSLAFLILFPFFLLPLVLPSRISPARMPENLKIKGTRTEQFPVYKVMALRSIRAWPQVSQYTGILLVPRSNCGRLHQNPSIHYSLPSIGIRLVEEKEERRKKTSAGNAQE